MVWPGGGRGRVSKAVKEFPAGVITSISLVEEPWLLAAPLPACRRRWRHRCSSQSQRGLCSFLVRARIEPGRSDLCRYAQVHPASHKASMETPNARLHGLDTLRALAIFLVMIFHLQGL